MALRRSGVRIPLGPPCNALQGMRERLENPSRSYAIIAKIFSKVRTGVVGYPVSEKGKRGGSPSLASNGNAICKDRTRLLPS